MEHLFYLIVKGLSVVYWLYKIFRFLFGEQGKSFWHFLTPNIREKKRTVMPQTGQEDTSYSIVGKSQTVYLAELPPPKKVELVFSEGLEQVPSYEEEPDVTSDDVDYRQAEEILTEEERFTPLDVEPDNEAVSTGMTYEQISQVLDVVSGKKTSDSDQLTAARTLYEVQGGDVFNFLTTQAENETVIERLMKENLDDRGEVLPKNRRKRRKEKEEFDMEKYV